MRCKEVIKKILDSINPGEEIPMKEIHRRLNLDGIKISMQELKMIIHYYMLHKYLGRKYFKGKYYYYLIYGR